MNYSCNRIVHNWHSWKHNNYCSQSLLMQLNNTHDATMHMIRQYIRRDIAGEPAEGALTC